MSRKRGRPPKHPVQHYDESMRLLIEAQKLKRGGAKRINQTLAGANRQADAIEKRRYRAKQFVMHEAAGAIEAEIEKLQGRIGTRDQLAEIVIAAAKELKPDKK